jgi:hypothetical protein
MTVIDSPLFQQSAMRPGPDTALGEAARALRDRRERALAFRITVSFGQRFRQAWESLRNAYLQALSENWDGYGGKAVQSSTVEHAMILLLALPTRFPLPEVGVEPDGEIALEWYIGSRAVFSVSVSQSGMLSYAGLYGRSRAHGIEPLVGSLPKALQDNLERLYRTATP